MGNGCSAAKNRRKNMHLFNNEENLVSQQSKPVYLTFSNLKIKNMSFVKTATYIIFKIGKKKIITTPVKGANPSWKEPQEKIEMLDVFSDQDLKKQKIEIGIYQSDKSSAMASLEVNLYDIATGPKRHDYIINWKNKKISAGQNSRVVFEVEFNQKLKLQIRSQQVTCHLQNVIPKDIKYQFSLTVITEHFEAFLNQFETINVKNKQLSRKMSMKMLEFDEISTQNSQQNQGQQQQQQQQQQASQQANIGSYTRMEIEGMTPKKWAGKFDKYIEKEEYDFETGAMSEGNNHALVQYKYIGNKNYGQFHRKISQPHRISNVGIEKTSSQGKKTSELQKILEKSEQRGRLIKEFSQKQLKIQMQQQQQQQQQNPSQLTNSITEETTNPTSLNMQTQYQELKWKLNSEGEDNDKLLNITINSMNIKDCLFKFEVFQVVDDSSKKEEFQEAEGQNLILLGQSFISLNKLLLSQNEKNQNMNMYQDNMVMTGTNLINRGSHANRNSQTHQNGKNQKFQDYLNTYNNGNNGSNSNNQLAPKHKNSNYSNHNVSTQNIPDNRDKDCSSAVRRNHFSKNMNGSLVAQQPPNTNNNNNNDNNNSGNNKVRQFSDKLWLNGKIIGSFQMDLMVNSSIYYLKQLPIMVRTERGIMRNSPTHYVAQEGMENNNQQLNLLKNLSSQLLSQIYMYQNTQQDDDMVFQIEVYLGGIIEIVKPKNKKKQSLFVFNTKKEKLQGQDQMIDLCIHLLQYADEIDDRLRNQYYDLLKILLNRGEFDLQEMGFNTKEYGHLLKNTNSVKDLDETQELKFRVAGKYHKLLFQCLNKAITKLIKYDKHLQFDKEREFVYNFLALAYFRIPEFKDKLLKLIILEDDPTFNNWRGSAEFRVQQNEERNFDKSLASFFDWQAEFHNYIQINQKDKDKNKKNLSILEKKEWQKKFSERGQHFFLFLREWASFVNKRVVTEELTWRLLPGYRSIIRGFCSAVTLNKFIVNDQYNSIQMAFVKLVNNEKLLNIYLYLLFQKTQVYDPRQVIMTFTILDKCLQYLQKKEKKLHFSFEYSYFLEGIKRILKGDHAECIMMVFNTILKNYIILPLDFKKGFSDFIFSNIFFKFFMHWSYNVRQSFYTFLLFRINHQHNMNFLNSQYPVVKKHLQKKTSIIKQITKENKVNNGNKYIFEKFQFIYIVLEHIKEMVQEIEDQKELEHKAYHLNMKDKLKQRRQKKLKKKAQTYDEIENNKNIQTGMKNGILEWSINQTMNGHVINQKKIRKSKSYYQKDHKMQSDPDIQLNFNSCEPNDNLISVENMQNEQEIVVFQAESGKKDSTNSNNNNQHLNNSNVLERKMSQESSQAYIDRENQEFTIRDGHGDHNHFGNSQVMSKCSDSGWEDLSQNNNSGLYCNSPLNKTINDPSNTNEPKSLNHKYAKSQDFGSVQWALSPSKSKSRKMSTSNNNNQGSNNSLINKFSEISQKLQQEQRYSTLNQLQNFRKIIMQLEDVIEVDNRTSVIPLTLNQKQALVSPSPLKNTPKKIVGLRQKGRENSTKGNTINYKTNAFKKTWKQGEEDVKLENLESLYLRNFGQGIKQFCQIIDNYISWTKEINQEISDKFSHMSPQYKSKFYLEYYLPNIENSAQIDRQEEAL